MTVSQHILSLDGQSHEPKIEFWARGVVIGTSGLLLGILPLLMIKKALYRLWELRRKMNNSLNILNVRVYQSMIISLGFQAVLTIYTSIIIIIVDIDRQKHQDDGQTDEGSYSYIARKVWLSFLIESILKFITVLTASLAYIY